MTDMTPTVGDGTSTGRAAYSDTTTAGRPRRRLATETKSAFKTTEFWLYATAVAAVLIASQAVGTGTRHVDRPRS
jgi:hypothetical protein